MRPRSIARSNAGQPSFCFDEFDSILADDDKAALRSVINSGHTRGQGVLRCIGDDKVPELFPTFAPKAIGMVGRKLPPATLSRCIFVELRRRKKDEHVEKFKHRDDSGLADLRRRLRRWAMDNEDTLRDAKPSMPDELQNRRADNWQLQLAIADLCSGAEDFGDKARAAAIKIEGKADNRTDRRSSPGRHQGAVRRRSGSTLHVFGDHGRRPDRRSGKTMGGIHSGQAPHAEPSRQAAGCLQDHLADSCAAGAEGRQGLLQNAV